MARVLIVGGGFVGERHLRAFTNLEATSVSVCDSSTARLDELDDRYSLNSTFGTLEEALEWNWDAAVVATPAPSHLPIGRRMTSSGIPVLVEKPLALAAGGIPEWIALAERRRTPVVVGFPFRTHPLAIVMRERLLAGDIGVPVQLTSTRGTHLPSRRPGYADSYYASERTGGGVVHDILSHTLNLCEWLLGPIDRLVADAGHLVLPNVDVPDTVHLLARHGRVMAAHSISQHQEVATFRVTVHGTAGSLGADFVSGELRQSSGPDGEWHRLDTQNVTTDRWFGLQAKTFLMVARGSLEPPCDLADGLETIRSVGAAIVSIREAVWVRPDACL